MPASAAIYGCLGTKLLPAEQDFFRAQQPFGFILFARNCADPNQIRALCAALREVAGNANAPVLIDQEGGRVARLKPPHWRAHPAAGRFGAMFLTDAEGARTAAYLNARLIAHDLREVGITVDCAPVLDLPVEGAHDVIGDRAFSRDPAIGIELGRASIDGFLDGGVLPVVKHIPGHGRATVDSHQALPRVSASRAELSAHDFVTFRSLNRVPLAMTAHVVYEALDAKRPATTSPKIIRDIIRGEIGFDGLLVSDDLSMAALDGSLGARAKAALTAGCDVVLHCNGLMDEMIEIAGSVKPLSGVALHRAESALAQIGEPVPFDVAAAQARLDNLMGAVA